MGGRGGGCEKKSKINIGVFHGFEVRVNIDFRYLIDEHHHSSWILCLCITSAGRVMNVCVRASLHDLRAISGWTAR